MPKLLIIEGLWGTGKTTFINIISNFDNYKIIPEIDHTSFRINKEISNWYFEKHKKLIKKAIKKLPREKILMDRSIISNAAYKYATAGFFDKNRFAKIFNIINSIDDFVLVFLTADKFFIEKNIKNIKDEEVKKLFLSKKDFYIKYKFFYKKILPKWFKGKIIYLKVNEGGKFIKREKLVSVFLNGLKEKNKIKSTCAASLSYYKDKILLLYDHNYNHYVIPQGHQKSKEKISETALRELSEETGFVDLKLVKKLKKYQYHYFKNNSIVYKQIHVYLVKIISKKRTIKKLGDHESYSNFFLKINDAMNKAKWKEDKNIIKLSKKFINKKAP